MHSQHIYDDFEKEMDKESIYLYEREHEQWLWWHEQWRNQEGSVRVEGIEEEETIENLPSTL